ncbi:M20/M25/M40 family metallo-hydrolase [bacterium]|nr:M20/M25/M40 family metallo-hydrolase [bacterium]
MPSMHGFLHYAKVLISCPTAPFREHWVAAKLDRLLAEIPGLSVAVDRFGNRIVRLKRGEPAGPLPVFVAHLDHPAFLIGGAVDGEAGEYLHEAVFEGGVQLSYFAGAPVRLYRDAEDDGVPGVVVSATDVSPETDNRSAILRTESPAEGAVLAMWDVPIFEEKDGMLHARVCDDLVGCAAILAALEELAQDTQPVDVAAIFSLGEEAGFCGTLCLLSEETLHPLLDRDGIFISVENSPERPGAVCGEGAIIRLGDRLTTFDSETAALFHRVARHRDINAKRVLMDGGACEATAFAQSGLRAAGLCVPLRNYHNMDRQAGAIAPEAVSIADAEALTALIRDFALHHGDPELPTGSIDLSRFLEKGLMHLGGN